MTCRRWSLPSRRPVRRLISEAATKEPRSSPSAVGEVELPHRRARAAPPSRDHELQGDAGRPHAPHGTHQATSTKMLNARGSDPRSPPKAGSAATSRDRSTQEETATRVSSGGRKYVDFSMRRPQPRSVPPPISISAVVDRCERCARSSFSRGARCAAVVINVGVDLAASEAELRAIEVFEAAGIAEAEGRSVARRGLH